MNDFIIGALCVALGWVLFQGTEALRTRRRNTTRLRQFESELLAIQTQVELAEADSSLIHTLSTVDSFTEISVLLTDEEYYFSSSRVGYWNMMRKAQPTVIAKISGLEDLSIMVRCWRLLRKPIRKRFYRTEANRCRAKIKELLDNDTVVRAIRISEKVSAE